MVRSALVTKALDGLGARLYGGRWNSPGTAVIYAADSRALAALEILAGTRRAGILDAYVVLGLEFDESGVLTLPDHAVPNDWRALPPARASRRVGDEWVAAGTSAVLRVPSAIVPAEHNYLLNPAHADFATLSVGPPVDFAFDPRLA